METKSEFPCVYVVSMLYLYKGHPISFCSTCINVYILAPENAFPEIIYAFFGGRQNIFLTILDTKFVVICAAKILKID